MSSDGTKPTDDPESSKWTDFYRMHLLNVILPFWKKAEDRVFGGVYTCYNNAGDTRLGTNKYTWSQGRMVWVWSRLCDQIARGIVPGDAEALRAQAARTVAFLEAHAFLEDGTCCFLLAENGDKLEPAAGAGYHTSLYADGFVMLGFAEYARAFGQREWADRALAMYRRIVPALRAGGIRSDPYPVPPELDAHGYHMIGLSLALQMQETAAAFGDVEAAGEALRDIAAFTSAIVGRFAGEDGLIRELIPRVPGDATHAGSLATGHVNPGHSIECMWFVLEGARRTGDTHAVAQAVRIVKRTFAAGWDERFGGLLRFVDPSGGRPTAPGGGTAYESMVADTWDTKLWWPHSEALYTTLLGYRMTGDAELLELHRRTHDYTFRTFPHPDPAVGEWIQIRTREGEPLNKVVALPVKDPYHIIRNLQLLIELGRDHSLK